MLVYTICERLETINGSQEGLQVLRRRLGRRV